MTIQLGAPAPDFTLPSQLGKNITLSDLRGKNVVLAFYPLAWTPVCTLQIPLYEAEMDKFIALDTQILSISVDSADCLRAWAESLGGIYYPMLSDFWPHGAVAQLYGVLQSDGRSERALFVIDKQGNIRYIDIHDIHDQPSNEVLRRMIREIDPEVKDRPELPERKPEILPHGGIVMYCNSWCPDCKRARKWLDDNNLAYTEVDITTTPGAAQQVEKWANGNRTTPTFDIDGTIVVDYDLPKLKEVLKL
ncbi:MAG: redoxin domain-containing protein [Anaerolineaceae bacterium]